jgi:DNA-binding LytR/AlgR family response regulator
VKLSVHSSSEGTIRERVAQSFNSSLALQPLANRPCVRVAIKVNGKILFVNLEEVIVVRAEGNYVSLQRNAGSYLVREPISVLADTLEPFGFIRIHRSILVNTSFVEEIRSDPTGEYRLRIQGGTEYLVTRTYKNNLKSLADYWLGTAISF